ncbi:MAG TPA: hypothetical protein VKT32_01780 [Chthonomonadaceae bacterium]|nr:hypothetical protein [Chthonomonadaceae bacterium]
MNTDRSWKILGPGGGGAQFVPAISPHDPRRVLVACDMTGAYITHDAGKSWRMFNLRGRVSFFAFDPCAPDTLYANAIGLWRSDDAGQTWSLVTPDPSKVKGLTLAGDHGEVTINTEAGPWTKRVTALTVDPADSNTLFAAIASGADTRLYVSSDRGRSWRRAAVLTDGGAKIYVDPRSPAHDRTLIVAGAKSVQWREGGRWKQGQTPAGAHRLREFSIGYPVPGEPPIVYAISRESIYVSDDGGLTWTDSPPPGETPEMIAVAACPSHPETAYISYRHLKIGGETFFGVMKTTNRGRSWQPVWKENERAAENIHDAWVTPWLGPGFGETPFSLAVGPNNPDLCYGTDWARTLRTADGGKTWQALYSRRLPDGSYTSTGLDVTTCYGVHFDPFDTKRVFLTYTDIGLFRSENGGRGWISSTQGVPHEWRNTTYWVVFDPHKQGRMWAAVSQNHDLPRPKMWRSQKVSDYQGGVCHSEDGGKTWRVTNTGMPQTAVTHILLDPESPPEARTLYAAGFGRGVYKSTDGGETWQAKNNGIEGAEPFAWRLILDGRGALYLIVARRSEDERIGDDQDGALYRSTDGAEHWTKLALPPDVNGPNGLAIDPADSRRLYLAAWSRPVNGRPVGGGVFLSEDGGTSWSNILDRDQHVYDVTIDPRHPNTLYACGFSSSAWKSTDRGQTWKRLQGYNFKWGHRVLPDPLDEEAIYVITYGGSLWHGPADGDPTAIEDIVEPPALCYEAP